MGQEIKMNEYKKIAVPDDVDFADLNLHRIKTGEVVFDWEPIEKICAANNIDVAIFKNAHEDNVASLLVGWYHQHLLRGGARNATQDDLMQEAVLEDLRGGGISHQPGSA
jgi:hypothetical protein